MAAIDVSAITPEIASQIVSVVNVGIVVLLVYAGHWSVRRLMDVIDADAEASVERYLVKGDRSERGEIGGQTVVGSAEKSVEQQAAAAKASLEGMREYERLGNVWQTWKDQSDAGPGPGRANIRKYDALVARGMDAQDAIAAIEMRNSAVARVEEREQAMYEAEHQAAIERYANAPEMDLTVRLGAGWK